MTRDLFSADEDKTARSDPTKPLADRMRPQTIDEVLGQDHLLSPGKFLREAVHSDDIPSMILWGPPGVGKTTIAHIIADASDSHFVAISAVLSGVKEVKQVIKEARYQRSAFRRNTILFVDEIHRFNKAQQDAFLPHVEDGTLTLIGATTENPSFEVISPLLSRSRVLVLHPLGDEQIQEILKVALADQDRGLGLWNLSVEDKALEQIALFANGDARSALNTLEVSAHLAKRLNPEDASITLAVVEESVQKKALLYDKSGEEHYNLISAFHKSMRNSDADAALYWMARMLESGEDPLYLARRMVRFASEDVGLADPHALGYAMDAMQAFHFIGLPEGNLALAQVVIYLSLAPKSNAVYRAYSRVREDVEKTRNEPVPLHIRNAPTTLMKELGYSEGYKSAHSEEDRIADMSCLPPNLKDRNYYRPTNQNFEKRLGERLREIRQIRARKQAETESNDVAEE
ncbi:MAG TPA: replication-associated recombination protein A [Acidobacteriota bacterium]|nr:replication-associated recombination protein A [Acidobacteriota bacterium]